MDLGLEEVAALLSVSEETVVAWAKQHTIPCYHMDSRLRFNQLEIENWLLQRRGQSSIETVSLKERAWQHYGLLRALNKGTVKSLSVSCKKEAICRASEEIASSLGLIQETVEHLLLDREQLMPTSLAKGMAIPHPREITLKGLYDALFIVYLDRPIEWGGLEENPVHTLFFLFACDDKRHLQLLAKIAHLANQKENRDFLSQKPNKEQLLQYVQSWEENLFKNPNDKESAS